MRISHGWGQGLDIKDRIQFMQPGLEEYQIKRGFIIKHIIQLKLD